MPMIWPIGGFRVPGAHDLAYRGLPCDCCTCFLHCHSCQRTACSPLVALECRNDRWWERHLRIISAFISFTSRRQTITQCTNPPCSSKQLANAHNHKSHCSSSARQGPDYNLMFSQTTDTVIIWNNNICNNNNIRLNTPLKNIWWTFSIKPFPLMAHKSHQTHRLCTNGLLHSGEIRLNMSRWKNSMWNFSFTCKVNFKQTR